MARQEGLEPPTYCLEGSCSIQLSYWRIYSGAGDGNRTRVSSLEGWCSTIELHPHKLSCVLSQEIITQTALFVKYKITNIPNPHSSNTLGPLLEGAVSVS